MAFTFTWNDIANEDAAYNIRTKLNDLGEGYERIASSVEGLEYGFEYYRNSIQEIDKNVFIASNVVCDSSLWVNDSNGTYIQFPFRADISISGVTQNMIPIVDFASEEQESENLCGAQTQENILTIWAKDKPTKNITIPTVVFLEA